jgi:hypothetical protein
LNETADIVTKNFTKGFVSLRDLGLASQAVAKLRLDHTESRFNVAALMVLLEKPLLIETEVVVHLMPESALALYILPSILCLRHFQSVGPIRRTVFLERYVGHRVMVYDRLQIRCRQVRLICGDFLHHKIPRGRINKGLKVFYVRCETIRNLNCGYDVRLNPANQVDLDPIAFGHKPFVFVLGVGPLIETASRLAGRINS